MLSERTTRTLEALSKVSLSGKKAKDLSRLMNHEDLWMQAYLNIQGNTGAITAGVNNDTIDGFSVDKVSNLTALLRENRYVPQPVKRLEMPKPGPSKMRPLGLPTGSDTLVQEAARMMLERIYEPIFHDESHGFRRKRSCHTALTAMRNVWTGTKWFVEADIKGFFDNIDHEIMVELLEKRIDDTRFVRLIKRMLKAGYLEDWVYHKTYSGTPQGGVISPILANIYLHELDEFVKGMQQGYVKGVRRKPNPEWLRVQRAVLYLRRKRRKLRGKGEDLSHPDLARLKLESQKLLTIEASDHMDPEYRRLHYLRVSVHRG